MHQAALLFTAKNENYFFEDQLTIIKSYLDLINVSEFQGRLDASVSLLFGAVSQGKPVLVCDNGGSDADSQHITG